jgi:protoporphyrinogen oxidase
MSPSGKAVLTAWSGHPMTLDLMDLPDDEIIDRAREDLEFIVPGFSDWIEETAMVRHSFGIARYPVGAYRRVLDFLEQAKRLEGVSFVSDLFGGCYMEAAMGTAADAVRRVCGWGGTA